NLDKVFEGNDTTDHVTMNESSKIAQLLCESNNPAASEAKIFAADSSYQTLEHQLYTVWGPTRMDVNSACKYGKRFSTHDFGKCVCAHDRGFSFCIWNVLGEYFEKEGYLSCAVDNWHFISAKKPVRMPVLTNIGTHVAHTTTAVAHRDTARASVVHKATTTKSITRSTSHQTTVSAPFTIPNNSRKQEKQWITLITLLRLTQHLLNG
ncbi:hypothetical protein PENTCL1PPCAC_12732, partial [Pristionchus entomophagus]